MPYSCNKFYEQYVGIIVITTGYCRYFKYTCGLIQKNIVII